MENENRGRNEGKEEKPTHQESETRGATGLGEATFLNDPNGRHIASQHHLEMATDQFCLKAAPTNEKWETPPSPGSAPKYGTFYLDTSGVSETISSSGRKQKHGYSHQRLRDTQEQRQPESPTNQTQRKEGLEHNKAVLTHGWLQVWCLLKMDTQFRYYFQHPWSRLLIAYLVTFFNFLLFAEDPVSHSQTEANMIVVGNCFSFVTNKYPGGGWNFLKVLLWLIAIVVGLFAGKFLFHQRLFGQFLRLKMFREDHGSWMTMFFSTILFLFIFSHIYNLCLLMAGNMRSHIITDYMGIRNQTFMKIAAVGTWMGDFVTAWMVTDMMLQDKQYPAWGKSARAFWKKGNTRIILFWTVLFTLTSVVVLVITTDWISWDKLNRGFLPSDEVSRAFLASFILVFDLLIVMQDWEFPHFMGDVDVNLPGLTTAHMQLKLPHFQSFFKEEYHIHITGKWFNYGIICLVLILDLNMWKNQIFYNPPAYGQYTGPGEQIFTVEHTDSLKYLNQTTLSWQWRSTTIDPKTNQSYADGDMFLHSRFTGVSLDVKCLAFIPSLLAFVLFGFFIWFFGRFHESEQGMENKDKSYRRIKRKSPSEHSQEMGMTTENIPAILEETLTLPDPPLVNVTTEATTTDYVPHLLSSENTTSRSSDGILTPALPPIIE